MKSLAELKREMHNKRVIRRVVIGACVEDQETMLLSLQNAYGIDNIVDEGNTWAHTQSGRFWMKPKNNRLSRGVLLVKSNSLVFEEFTTEGKGATITMEMPKVADVQLLPDGFSRQYRNMREEVDLEIEYRLETTAYNWNTINC